jgi:hypothetical protein
MNKLIFLTLLIFTTSCNWTARPAADNVFSTITYDNVVAYDYNGEGGIEIIDDKGQLAGRVKKSIRLDKSQITEITNLLCDKATYGDDIAACFDPHLGLVFYDGEKVNAYVSICLECNYLVSSIKIPDTGSDNIVSFQKRIGF